MVDLQFLLLLILLLVGNGIAPILFGVPSGDGRGPQSRSFLWILIHEKLLTNRLCVRKIITDDASCPGSGANEETCLHAIRDCAWTE